MKGASRKQRFQREAFSAPGSLGMQAGACVGFAKRCGTAGFRARHAGWRTVCRVSSIAFIDSLSAFRKYAQDFLSLLHDKKGKLILAAACPETALPFRRGSRACLRKWCPVLIAVLQGVARADRRNTEAGGDSGRKASVWTVFHLAGQTSGMFCKDRPFPEKGRSGRLAGKQESASVTEVIRSDRQRRREWPGFSCRYPACRLAENA